jgi:hypothetical protein
MIGRQPSAIIGMVLTGDPQGELRIARRVRTSAGVDIAAFRCGKLDLPGAFLTHIKAAERRRAMLGARSVRLRLA